MASLSQDQLLRLARHGAAARIAELRDEIAAIEQAFPELRRGGRGQKRAARGAAQQGQSAAADRGSSRSGRRGWSAAQRKAAADRMRAYWAKRKGSRKK